MNLRAKSDQSVKTSSRIRKTSRNISKIQEPMVSPALVSSLRSQGINLSNTSIDVLKLKGCELKKLRGLGMLNLEQLANATESVLRAVPHFGVMKVKKLKTRLNAYILGLHPGLVMLSESNAEIDTGRERVIADSDDMAISSTFEFISELEEASESLEKLRKRIRLYVAEIKRQQVR